MTGRLPEAILLDLDDTILAYDAVVEGCWQSVCARFADRAGCPAGRLYAAIQDYAGWFWSDPERHRRGRLDQLNARRHVVKEGLCRAGIQDARLADEMAAAYSTIREERLAPFPGAIETLSSLRARNCRMALLTNGSEELQRRKIERFGLARFFDCIVVEGAFGCGKPDSRVFRHALDCLNTAPADAWMVGDNLEADVAGAQGVGIYAIWHDYRRAGLPPDCPVRPDRIIYRLIELLEGGSDQ